MVSPAEFFYLGGWILLAAVGLWLGAVINWAVYELAYQRRPISPWCFGRSHSVTWVDRLPMVGWFFLRREESLWGRRFWLRPLLVEGATAVAVPALYHWEVVQQALDFPTQPVDGVTLHVRWIFHTIFLSILAAGSLIDIDERTLPDGLTLPGTLLGLAVAAAYPWAILPDIPASSWGLPREEWTSFLAWQIPAEMAAAHDFRILQVASPHAWPPRWGGAPHLSPLILAAALWWLWCFALMDRRWYPRLGLRRAWGYFWARLLRSQITHWLFAVGVVGSLVITAVWIVGGLHWQGLFSALVGLAVGVGVVWIVRLVGWWALRKEAMGFGDVILMGMLGTVVGWQGVLIIFFLAPVVALGFGILHALFYRETVIPYGPFLCLAAALLILFWRTVWPGVEPIFRLGWTLALVLGGCLLLLPPLLVVVRLMRELIESAVHHASR